MKIAVRAPQPVRLPAQLPPPRQTRLLERAQPRRRDHRRVVAIDEPEDALAVSEQVAALALFLCGDDAAQITGANLSIDGGWTAE